MKVYERSSSLDDLIDKTLSNLKIISDTKTIFGEATTTADGTVIIPISKVTIGFVVGGGEYADLSTRRVGTHYPMAGGSGGGISLTPIGFLVNTDKEVRYISTMAENNCQKIMESMGKVAEYLAKKVVKRDKKGAKK